MSKRPPKSKPAETKKRGRGKEISLNGSGHTTETPRGRILSPQNDAETVTAIRQHLDAMGIGGFDECVYERVKGMIRRYDDWRQRYVESLS